VLLVGIFLDEVREAAPPLTYLPIAIAVWPLLPLFITNETSLPIRDLRHLRQQQQMYRESLALLQQTPGAAICESLLLCAEAGKPYLYDPFNATRFIQLGKLDPSPLYSQLANRQFAAVQLNKSIDLTKADTDANRFTPEMIEIIRKNYTPFFQRDGVLILVPAH
jgi:hypothetical protein